MDDFKFEYEVNPISRANAALDNEGQRMRDELEQARHSFRRQFQRVLAGSAIAYVALSATMLIVERFSGPFQHSPLVLALAYVPVGAAVSIARRRGGLARLMTAGTDVIRAKKHLAD